MKLNYFKYALFLALPLLIFASCEEEIETGDLTVEFVLTKDGNDIALNDVFANDSVAALRVEKLKFYISHLTLKGEGELEAAEIVDFESGRTAFTYRDIVAANYNGMTFYVGLDSTQNATYPPDVTTGDPLSATWAMYWSWAMKYRFIIMEGRGATDGTIDGSTDDFFFVLHPGEDGFQQHVVSDVNVDIKGGQVSVVRFKIDVDDVFNGPGGLIDLRTENSTHNTPSDRDLAEKFIINFGAAISR